MSRPRAAAAQDGKAQQAEAHQRRGAGFGDGHFYFRDPGGPAALAICCRKYGDLLHSPEVKWVIGVDRGRAVVPPAINIRRVYQVIVIHEPRLQEEWRT